MQKESSPLAAIEKELQRYRDAAIKDKKLRAVRTTAAWSVFYNVRDFLFGNDSEKYKAVKGWAVRALAVGLPLKGIRDFLNDDARNMSVRKLRNKSKKIVPQESKRREKEKLGPLWSQEIMKKAGWSPVPAAQRLAMTDPEYQALFKSGNRITLPFMQGADVKVYRWLEQQGYKVQDYQEGIAVKIKPDGRVRKLKIGKLLNGGGAEGKELLSIFAKRSFDTLPEGVLPDELRVVISRDPFDIMRASTGRDWTSCMNAGRDDSYHKKIQLDQKHGTLVAYLVHKDDPTILWPLARVLIKPYQDEAEENRILIADKVYGQNISGFKETINYWLDNGFNLGKLGRFLMHKELYNDGLDSSYERHSPQTKALFDAVGENNLEKIRQAIQNGADIDARDTNGQTPHKLALKYSTKEIKELFNKEKKFRLSVSDWRAYRQNLQKKVQTLSQTTP